MGSVTGGGALAGMVIAFVLMVASGMAGFLPLLTLFLLTVLATRWGWRRKERLGLAERKGGRTASQVLANLAASAGCAGAVIWFPEFGDLLLAGSMAALAEAAADTVSSEIGQASSSRAHLILGFQPVPIGTNGAISFSGTVAGFVAACLIAWVSAAFDVVSAYWVPVIAIAGTAGMMIDSLLGAALENSGRVGNDAVNFLSTVCAADLALLTGLVLERIRR
jgi:uncharacterized protein (TIGR00297 family)